MTLSTIRPSIAARAALLGLAVGGALLTGGCGANLQDQIRQQANADIAALATLDAQTVSSYFPAEDVARLSAAGVDPAAFYGTLFEGVQCTVAGVDVEGGAATAHLYVTARDLAGVFDALRTQLNAGLSTAAGRTELAALDDAQAAARSLNAFLDLAAEQEPQFGTTKLDLAYVRDGSRWVLADVASLERALLGGFDPVAAAASAPGIADEAPVQTDTPYSSVVATVDDNGYTSYVR